MATQAILVVVVVRDSGLRSALVARLSLDGFDLLSASGIGYGLLGSSMVRRPAALVIDEALIPGDCDRWIEKQRSVGEWRRLAVVGAAGQAPEDDWCHRFTPRAARTAVCEMLLRCANEGSAGR